MTKQVLLFGALAAAALLSMWLLFDVAPAAVLGVRAGESPFSGMGGPFRFWLGLLAVALVRDYVVRRRDRNAVRPFAAALEPEVAAEHVSVMQGADGFADYTGTLGTLGNRTVNVTLREVAGSRTGPTFRVDVSCDCPWVLDIRRRTTFARLLGWAGSVISAFIRTAGIFDSDTRGICPVCLHHWTSTRLFCDCWLHSDCYER